MDEDPRIGVPDPKFERIDDLSTISPDEVLYLDIGDDALLPAYRNLNNFGEGIDRLFEARVIGRTENSLRIRSTLNDEILEIPFDSYPRIHRQVKIVGDLPEPGDLVQIGNNLIGDAGFTRRYKVLSGRHQAIEDGQLVVGRHSLFRHSRGIDFPVVGKVIKTEASGDAIVEISIHVPGTRMYDRVRIRVPRDDVFPSRIGNASRLNEILDEVYSAPLNFAKNETAWMRNKNGILVPVKILEDSGDVVQVERLPLSGLGPVDALKDKIVQNTPFKRKTIPKEDLQRQIGPQDPDSADRYHYLFKDKIHQSKEAMAFMKAAGRFASTNHFRALPREEQFELLGRFVQKFLPWKKAGAHDYLPHLGQQLCFGSGVCRHHNLLLGLTLKELGFPVRVVTSEGFVPLGPGHLWIEAVDTLGDGSQVTYRLDVATQKPIVEVIDPNANQAVRRTWEFRDL